MVTARKTEYKCGDEAEGGYKIADILGSAPHFIVYFTPDDYLRWEVDDDHTPAHFPVCVERFDSFHSMIGASVPRKTTKKQLRRSLGIALYGAVVSENADGAMHHFSTVGTRLEGAIALHARIFYVLSSLVSATFFVAALAALWVIGYLDQFIPYMLAAGAGCGGAAISVLLRSSDIAIPLHSTPGEHLFRGLSRTILGLLSGLALACVIQGNLLLGIAAQNLPALAALGLVAGFSERYLPRILETVERQSLERSEKGPDA